MPPGATPPLILNYDASTVPVIQLVTSSKTLNEQQILDLTQNFMRPPLSTIAGTAIPYAYGGKVRQIQVDLNPQELQALGLSAADVQNAITQQNQILPAGTVKIGSFQYTVNLNDAAPTIAALNNLPIKTVDGATIYVRDVANVRDGAPPQTNIVHVNGQRAVLTSILKTGSGSTLAVVQGVKDMLPSIEATMPAGLQYRYHQRPINLRESGGLGGDPRRRDRRVPDQPDDPGVSGQLALDADHRHVHSLVDSLLRDGAFRDRPDLEHHDAGRPCFGGRHSGG